MILKEAGTKAILNIIKSVEEKIPTNVQEKLTVGDNIDITNNVISATYKNATTTKSGLMSASDKIRLNKSALIYIIESESDFTLASSCAYVNGMQVGDFLYIPNDITISVLQATIPKGFYILKSFYTFSTSQFPAVCDGTTVLVDDDTYWDNASGYKAGDHISIKDRVISASFDNASETEDGLMSSSDKAKLDALTGNIKTISQESDVSLASGLAYVKGMAVGDILNVVNDITLSSSTRATLPKGMYTLSKLYTFSGSDYAGVALGTDILLNDTTYWTTRELYQDATESAHGLMSASDKKKLDGIASGAEVNVQSDFSVTDTTSDAYIKNKPTTISGYGITDAYTKTETYTKSETTELISTATKNIFVVADTLPTASKDTLGKIYLIPNGSTTASNVRDEYITVEGSDGTYSWELVGSTEIDLSGYAKTVKVGDTSYNVSSNVVSLPSYPTIPATYPWKAIVEKPTTLSGYGITDAKIDNGTITLGTNTITPLTSFDGLELGARNRYYLKNFGSIRKVNASSYSINSDGTINLTASGSELYIGEVMSSGTEWSDYYSPLMYVEGAKYVTFTISNPLFTKNFYNFLDADKKAISSYSSIAKSQGTISVPTDAVYLAMRIGYEGAESGTTYSLRIKVEMGNKATDWTPAVEDMAKSTDLNNYLPLSGGTMTGNISWKDENALPRFSGTIPYFLGIESFASGGGTKWQSASSINISSFNNDSGYITSSGSCASATSSDTVDGWHFDMFPYTNSYEYTQPTADTVWYLKVSTPEWWNNQAIINIASTGNNYNGHTILMTGARHSYWCGYATTYNGLGITGVKKAVSNSDDIYLEIPAKVTKVVIKTTFSATITDTSTTNYVTVPSNGGFFGNYITANLNGNATSADNADTVDGYHSTSLWRSDGATWNPNANITLSATANTQEWSFDIHRNGYTGTYWHIWDSSLGSMLKVEADSGLVSAPYGFSGTLYGSATSLSTTTNSASMVANEVSTYGQWRLGGSRGSSYSGILLGSSSDYMTIMDNTTDKGLFQEGKEWILYYNKTSACMGIGTSTLDTSYKLTVGGGININNGLLSVVYNGNTLKIGSRNNAWCHFENSADIPFWFNKSIYTAGDLMPYSEDGNSHNIGSSSVPFTNVYTSALNTAFIFNNSDMGEGATNLSYTTSAHTLNFYRNGLSIPYQMDNSNDGGILRCRGTSESSCILELATWDDSGAGETIEFNYYPTTSQVTPTYSVVVPKRSGTIALTGDNLSSFSNDVGYITSSGSCASATKATQDSDGNTINTTYYKLSNVGSTTFKVTRNSSQTTSCAGYWSAMCNSSSTGSPTLPSSGKWWHIISMDWTGNDTSNWISQLALPTQDGGAPHYRRNNASGTAIDSSTWHSFITDENISSQSVSYATSAGNSSTVGGYSVSESATASTVVARNSSGYIYANYINTNIGVEDGTITNLIYDNGDGWMRKTSLAHLKDSIGTASTSSAGLMSATDKANLNWLMQNSIIIISSSDQLTNIGGSTWYIKDTPSIGQIISIPSSITLPSRQTITATGIYKLVKLYSITYSGTTTECACVNDEVLTNTTYWTKLS